MLSMAYYECIADPRPFVFWIRNIKCLVHEFEVFVFEFQSSLFYDIFQSIGV